MHGKWIGPHISHWILLRKYGDSIRTFDEDDLVINLPWEHALYGFSLDKKSLRSLKDAHMNSQ